MRKTDVQVKYPDDEELFEVQNVSALIISPGPGYPLDNQSLMKIIEYYDNKLILGVCLGIQALTCYYGGEVIQGSKVMHGKEDKLQIINETPI